MRGLGRSPAAGNQAASGHPRSRGWLRLSACANSPVWAFEQFGEINEISPNSYR